MPQIERVLGLTTSERDGFDRAAARFPVAVTPYYAALIDPEDPRDPLRRQVVPRVEELQVACGECVDPLAEERHAPVPALVHRYPDRVLLYATHLCAAYCRHCNRRRKVGQAASAPRARDLSAAYTYIQDHREVRDVLVSGGDPFTLSDEKLGEILEPLRSIEHVEIIRLATRTPVTLPQRMGPQLAEVLRRYQPLYVNTQFNHPREGTPAAAEALRALVEAGCVLGNQMVLLRGINDDPLVVRELNHWLLRQRCRPYYIFQCDEAEGLAHFRTPIAAGLGIVEALRGWTSGLAVPHYVVDLSGGGGKVALQPNCLISQEGPRYTFRNYQGKDFCYVEGEPSAGRIECVVACRSAPGGPR